MGVPRFGELIRRRYGKCWFQEGKANVFTNRPGELDLSVDGLKKRRVVDTLFVDGNGLLHPAMQFTFAYGSFEDAKRQEENLSKTEDQLIADGTRYFMNAIESLCLEFRPERLVLAIDGSAPIAKMIQQRQRRFGAKIDVTNDSKLSNAWEETLRKSVKNSLQEEGSYVSVTIEFDASRRDFGEGLINTRLELLQPGSPQDQIFRSLIENLVNGKGKGEKLRWYNVLSPETPLGFQFEGKWWYSIAMAATALAWRDIWRQSTYISLFSMDSKPDLGIDRDNKYIYVHGSGKIVTPEDSPVYKYVEEFRRFRTSNSDFLVKFSNKIAYYCEKIGDYLAETSEIYRTTLLLTGMGTNLEKLDGRRIDWLMNVRTRLIQRLEKEFDSNKRVSQPSSSNKDEVEYPEYEGGFRGVEGVLHVSKFDSNSLTPGTNVMNLIDKNIQRMINKDGKFELSDGTLIDILYSSHRLPGEGEHKLENLIDRETRNMSGKVSLVYGLDADLFMLSMVRDYPICLVRENSMRVEKFFGKIPRKTSSKVASCHVVDIERLKQLLADKEETGKYIHPHDFTFICFLFGNDFLRNVPGLIFDTNLQVVFDNKKSKKEEEESDANPQLFDFIFDVYMRVRQEKKLGDNYSLFVNPSRDIMKVNWFNFYDYLAELCKAEKNIYGGLIRRMQREEEKEKLMTSAVPDYVPVNLRYGLLKKAIVERQVIKGGVIDQKAEWIRGIDAFDMEEFKKLWTGHMTSNIPGFDESGVVRGLTKNKEDVVEKICKTYLEGMEWAMKYYTNRHSYLDDKKTGMRKSVLDTKWYYPYFQAPMLNQLRDELWKSIMTDARRLFVLSEKERDVEVRLRILFSGFGQKTITPEMKTLPGLSKTEKDLLDLIPEDYLKAATSKVPVVLSPDVMNQVIEKIKDYTETLKAKNLRIPAASEYSFVVKRFMTNPTSYRYLGENVFSERWISPRPLYGTMTNELLVAPSSTNYKVQLLAVLPQQSHKLFPDGILPSEPQISWMFPTSIPVDFTFRDRVHASILMIPPPNIDVLENHLKYSKVQQAIEQIRNGMFPDKVDSPAINPNALKKVSYYDSFMNVLRDIDNLDHNALAIDVFGGVGISGLALAREFDKVITFESNRENFQDLMTNVDQTRSSNLETQNTFFQPEKDFKPETGFVMMDLFYELPVRPATKFESRCRRRFGRVFRWRALLRKSWSSSN